MNTNLWVELKDQQAEAINGGLRVILDFNTDRVGQDYNRRNGINNLETCMNLCIGDSRCKAFTHVPPGLQPGQPNPEGICWLKDGVPQATPRQGLTSGIKS